MCRTLAESELERILSNEQEPQVLLEAECVDEGGTACCTACYCDPSEVEEEDPSCDDPRSSPDGARVGRKGDGCYVWAKSGECLMGDDDFEGCDPADDASCDGVCEELTTRLAADAKRTVDWELMYTECVERVCWAVARIEDRCYARNDYLSFSVAHTHDCSLGGEAILREHLAEEPE